jgi:iron complex transport system ATP-binding protein
MIEFKDVSYAYPEGDSPVFTGLSLSLPEGLVSLIGQNGTGKSTLLLLAGGRLIPDSGDVIIEGRNTREFASEEDRAKYAAFVYQNMEFETGEPVGALLTYVYENGFHAEKDLTFIDELVEVFELTRFMDRKTQELSKGELQRIISRKNTRISSFFLEKPRRLRSASPRTSLKKKSSRRRTRCPSTCSRKRKIFSVMA